MQQNILRIKKELLKLYCFIVIPAWLLTLGWLMLKKMGNAPAITFLNPPLAGEIFFILAITFGIALPIGARVHFISKVSAENAVSLEEFLAFEKRITTLALLASYPLAGAYIAEVSMFHFGGACLAALYACYYYFPTTKRITYEARLFRTCLDDTSEEEK